MSSFRDAINKQEGIVNEVSWEAVNRETQRLEKAVANAQLQRRAEDMYQLNYRPSEKEAEWLFEVLDQPDMLKLANLHEKERDKIVDDRLKASISKRDEFKEIVDYLKNGGSLEELATRSHEHFVIAKRLGDKGQYEGKPVG